MEDQDQLILDRFGKRVQQLRKATGMNVRDFAIHADMDHTHLNKIEKGKKNTTLLTIMKLAEGFGVEPPVLFTDEDPETALPRHLLKKK